MRASYLTSIILFSLAIGCSDDSSTPTSDGGGHKDVTTVGDSTTPNRDGSTTTTGFCELTCSKLEDCPQGAKYCENSTCFVCKSNSDCQYGVCNTQTGFCVECLQDSDCTYQGAPLGSGKCHPEANICAKCESNTDCSVQSRGGAQAIWTGKCDTSEQLCVRCDNVSDCQVQDQQGNLWPYDKCSTNSQCVECTSDADCAGGAFSGCDADGFCNECRSDAECCGGTAGCGLTCQLDGRCSCSSTQQCNDVAPEGLWTCSSL